MTGLETRFYSFDFEELKGHPSNVNLLVPALVPWWCSLIDFCWHEKKTKGGMDGIPPTKSPNLPVVASVGSPKRPGIPSAVNVTAAKSSEPSELHNRRQPWWVEYLHRSRTPVIRRELTFLRFFEHMEIPGIDALKRFSDCVFSRTLAIFFRNFLEMYLNPFPVYLGYCWWKKSCTTWDV